VSPHPQPPSEWIHPGGPLLEERGARTLSAKDFNNSEEEFSRTIMDFI